MSYSGVFRGLVFASPWGLGEEALRRGKKGSTVGRLCDLPWVALTTYSRLFRRPTVGLFLGALKERAQVVCKRGGSTQRKGAFWGGWRGGWFLRSFCSFWSGPKGGEFVRFWGGSLE